MAKYDPALANGQTSWQDQYRWIISTGETATVADRVSFIRNDAGKPVRIIGSLLDVTAEQEEIAGRLQSQKLEALGQLTGGVAHDFNNLLTIILGNAEIMMLNSTSAEQHQLAETTIKAAEHAAALTTRLLAFSRKQPLESKPVNMNDIVASMVVMVRRSLGENVEITLKLTSDAGRIEVDASQFEVALLNLAINARDAMPGGGKLAIETFNVTIQPPHALGNSDFAAGDYVVLEMDDTGTGMPSHVLDRIFEPFFTTKDVGQGSGLGLSMVYGFVKQSGGRVSVASEMGCGTSIKLYLPRVNVGFADELVVSVPDEIVRGSELVLVVEDNLAVRQHLVSQLHWLGYRTVQAENAIEALSMLKSQNHIDLLMTDVMMPGGMDGHALASMATLLLSDLKVLFTSGYNKIEMIHSGRLGPEVDLLSKPYRRHKLAAKLRKVLDR